MRFYQVWRKGKDQVEVMQSQFVEEGGRPQVWKRDHTKEEKRTQAYIFTFNTLFQKMGVKCSPQSLAAARRLKGHKNNWKVKMGSS